MTERLQESRHLPAADARRLTDLGGGAMVLDGRSRKWVEKLAETGFVSADFNTQAKRTTITVAITERGKAAIERDRRGVDPYLVMTP